MKRLQIPNDRQSIINLYFSSIVVLIALLVGFMVLGTKVYKHMRYSKFNLFVQGKPTLQYAPLFVGHGLSHIIPDTVDGQITSYEHLDSSTWGKATTAYNIGDHNGLWFQVKPQLDGDIVLTSPAAGTPLADVGFGIRNPQGQTVKVLVPGEWYKVRQYGQWYTLKIQWDQ